MTKSAVRLALALLTVAGLTAGCSSSKSASVPASKSTTTPRSVVTSTVPAKTFQLRATLDARQVVTPSDKPWTPPANVASASGTFSGSLDGTTRRLSWRLAYNGMGKPALPIADIHLGRRGHFGAVLVRLCGPCTPSGDSGVVKVTSNQAAQLVSGNSWVTLITEKYPNGVIRGQISTT
jgi:CHRD domain